MHSSLDFYLWIQILVVRNCNQRSFFVLLPCHLYWTWFPGSSSFGACVPTFGTGSVKCRETSRGVRCAGSDVHFSLCMTLGELDFHLSGRKLPISCNCPGGLCSSAFTLCHPLCLEHLFSSLWVACYFSFGSMTKWSNVTSLERLFLSTVAIFFSSFFLGLFPCWHLPLKFFFLSCFLIYWIFYTRMWALWEQGCTWNIVRSC
jgi:hypothetical protein